MRCPNCGTENQDGAKFCIECGSSLITVEDNNENENKNINKKTFSSLKRSIIAVLLSAIVIVCGIGILNIFMNNGDNTDEDVSPDQGQTVVNQTVSNKDAPSQVADTLFAKLENDKQNAPVKVTIRELIAKPENYYGKRIELLTQKVLSNDVSRGCLSVSTSTGNGIMDYDMDVNIEVFYDKLDDADKWRDLQSNKSPVIDVIGIYTPYSNDVEKGYIQAEAINLKMPDTQK